MRFLSSLLIIAMVIIWSAGCGEQTFNKNKEKQELAAGVTAPDFTLADQNGESHTLSNFKGKNVVLYFYPKDDTSG